MAGIGKLTKLLVKMGQKDLVRNFSKAPVKTALKTAGKITLWPFKKVGQGIGLAHTKQGLSFVEDFDTDELIPVFNKFYKYGMIGSGVTLAGSMGYMIAADKKEEQLGGFGASMGTLLGFLAGGPIGAALGCAAGYFLAKPDTPKQTQQPKAEQAVDTELKPEADPEAETVTAQPDSVATDSVATDSIPAPIVAPTVPADSTIVAPTDSIPSRPVAPSDSTQVAPADSTVVTPVVPAAPDSTATEPIQQTPPASNLFGGTLNEISIKQYEVQPKDCLWNIAKRELQKANPGKTVTNAHILQQVKEFIRLNPQIKNPDLIYPNQKIKTAA